MISYYLIDKLTQERVGILKAALEIIPELKSVTLHAEAGLVVVTSTLNIKEKIVTTCRVCGTPFRTQVNKRDIKKFL